MVVIVIIGILIGLLLPAIQKARAVARNRACQNCLRGLGTSAFLYAEDHDGALPYYEPEPRSSAGLLFPLYADNVLLYHCPLDTTPRPSTIDMELHGDDVTGVNGAAMSYDGHLDLELALECAVIIDGQPVSTCTPLLWDWYGGLVPGEGTAEQRALNNHSCKGGNVLYMGGNVRWVPAGEWSKIGNNRVPDFME
jgi:hypothetical protein